MSPVSTSRSCWSARSARLGSSPRSPSASRPVVLESRSVDDLCAFARAVGRMQVTPNVVDLHWPEGVAVVRFDSSERGADVQARRVTAEIGGRVLEGPDELAMTDELVGSVWRGLGDVAALAVLPSHVGPLLTSMSGGICDA